MSDQRINLADLVEMATAEMLDQRDFDILCDAVPVLVEAVEAAHDLLPRYYGDDYTALSEPHVEQSVNRLSTALARFSFGERP